MELQRVFKSSYIDHLRRNISLNFQTQKENAHGTYSKKFTKTIDTF